MEAAGAVCLPAAGLRNARVGDTYVYYVGILGYYWSSTPNDNNDAYRLYFNSDYGYSASSYDRYYAYAVRLVTDVK